MAFGMRHWIGVALLGCAIIAIRYLPPDSSGRRRAARSYSPAETRARQLRDQAWQLNEVQKRIAWADSLLPLTVAAEEGDVVVGAPERIDAASLEHFRDNIRHELDALGPRDRSVRLGFFLQDMKGSSYSGAPSSMQGIEYMAGTREGIPYCVAVRVERWPDPVHLANRQWGAVGGRSNILGQCRLVVRYGLPGPGTGEWLRHGGLRFGEDPAMAETATEEPILGSGASSPPPNFRARRTMFGMRMVSRDLQTDRCMAGYRKACRDVVTDSRLAGWMRSAGVVLEQSPVWSFESPRYGGDVSVYDGSILANLEAEYGREAFARFWRSELPVNEAFQDAFGTDMGEWTYGWAERTDAAVPPGPHVALGSVLGTLVLLLAAGGMGVGWARTREVTG